MALNKAQLKSQLQAAFKKARQQTENPDQALDMLSTELADAIDVYAKTAAVSTTVTGTCATPAGAGTIAGTGTGTVS